MAPLDNTPDLLCPYEELMAQKEAIEAALAPIRAEYDTLQEEMTPLLDRQRELGTQMKTITAEREHLGILRQMSAIALANGGGSPSQSLRSQIVLCRDLYFKEIMMAYLDEMPGLKDLFNSLMAQKEAIEAALAPIRAEYDGLQAEMTPLLDRQRELGAQIKTIIAERKLGAIQNQLSAIARAAGGRSTSQSMDAPVARDMREMARAAVALTDSPAAQQEP